MGGSVSTLSVEIWLGAEEASTHTHLVNIHFHKSQVLDPVMTKFGSVVLNPMHWGNVNPSSRTGSLVSVVMCTLAMAVLLQGCGG